MPDAIAIATTKRKFYKALDALTSSTAPPSPPPPPPPTTNSGSTSSNKRNSSAAAAFDEARERARKRLRQSTSTTSLNHAANTSVISLPPRKIPAPPASRDNSKPPPHFSPWSQETFLARLKTFRNVSQWHPKPDPIDEVEWAKRGWVCVDVNTVACKGGCERRVVVSLDVAEKKTKAGHTDKDSDEEDAEAEAEALGDALAERYMEEITEGHSSSCMWYKSGCKDDIYRLPVVRPSIWQPELRKRFRSLLEIDSSIDKVKIRALDDTSEKLLKELPVSVLDTDTTQPVCGRAFVISMHGWRGSCDTGNELLECDACFQRIGLWMYQPDYRSSRRDNVDDETKGEEEECNPALIDLVEFHREHCPWRNPVTQKASGSLTGLHACQILHRVVVTCARDHRRRSREQHAHEQESHAQQQGEEETAQSPRVQLSREEIMRQDKERESKLRKLKNLFHIKRRSTTVKTPAKAGAT